MGVSGVGGWGEWEGGQQVFEAVVKAGKRELRSGPNRRFRCPSKMLQYLLLTAINWSLSMTIPCTPASARHFLRKSLAFVYEASDRADMFAGVGRTGYSWV